MWYGVLWHLLRTWLSVSVRVPLRRVRQADCRSQAVLLASLLIHMLFLQNLRAYHPLPLHKAKRNLNSHKWSSLEGVRGTQPSPAGGLGATPPRIDKPITMPITSHSKTYCKQNILTESPKHTQPQLLHHLLNKCQPSHRIPYLVQCRTITSNRPLSRHHRHQRPAHS